MKDLTIIVSVILVLAVYVFMNRQIIYVEKIDGLELQRIEIINRITGNVRVYACGGQINKNPLCAEVLDFKSTLKTNTSKELNKALNNKLK